MIHTRYWCIVMCTAHYITHHNNQRLHKHETLHESPPYNTRRNTTSAGLVVCAVDHMWPRSHRLLFSPCDPVCSFLLHDSLCSTETDFILWKAWTLVWLMIVGSDMASREQGRGVLGWWQAAWWVKTLPRPGNEREIRKSPIPLSVMSHTCTLL